jgi:hypothetical protein
MSGPRRPLQNFCVRPPGMRRLSLLVGVSLTVCLTGFRAAGPTQAFAQWPAARAPAAAVPKADRSAGPKKLPLARQRMDHSSLRARHPAGGQQPKLQRANQHLPAAGNGMHKAGPDPSLENEKRRQSRIDQSRESQRADDLRRDDLKRRQEKQDIAHADQVRREQQRQVQSRDLQRQEQQRQMQSRDLQRQEQQRQQAQADQRRQQMQADQRRQEMQAEQRRQEMRDEQRRQEMRHY